MTQTAQSVAMWVKLDKKEGRDCFLLRSLHTPIHHTLMVQWQKDPRALNIHSCTQNTHMYIHTYLHTHVCSIQHSPSQKGSKIYLQYNTTVMIAWLIAISRHCHWRRFISLSLCPPMQLVYLCAKLYYWTMSGKFLFKKKKHSQGKRNIYVDTLPLTKEKAQAWESLVLQFPAQKKALENSNYCLATLTYHIIFCW